MLHSKEEIQAANCAIREREARIKANRTAITKSEGVRAMSRVSFKGEVCLEQLNGERIESFFAEFIYPRNEHGRVMLLNVTSHLLYDLDTGECLTSSMVRLDTETLVPFKIGKDALSRLLSNRKEKEGPKAITIGSRRRSAVSVEDETEDDDACEVAAAVMI